jgi:hypothetical protein
MRRLLTAFALALALAPAAYAGGPTMTLGAAEDAVRSSDLVGARSQMTVLRVAGFRAVRVTSIWQPGQTAPRDGELQVLKNVEAAAQLTGMRVYLAVFHAGSRTTPLTAEMQNDFARWAAAIAREVPAIDDLIIGNEPNINRFWLPQFGPAGENVAAPTYLSLLTKTYDALKAADPRLRVWGGALSPRGSDRAGTARDTHSPTKFLSDLGAAYRASGRQTPIMDGLAIHPYGENSSISPELAHPRNTVIGIADYTKLVGLLSQAFDGSPQKGSTLPIVYAEYGVESTVPDVKRSLYSGSEPATTRPVDEAKQASYYAKALELTFCQPNVQGFFVFHTIDETPLDRWQSGLFYADGTPKASYVPVREALARARGGSIARCPGLALPVQATNLRYPGRLEVRNKGITVRLRCDLDCVYSIRLRKADTGATTISRRGRAKGGDLSLVSLGRGRVAPGRYFYTVQLRHPVNPAAPTILTSEQFRLP